MARILVVDDESAQRLALATMLGNAGHTVVEVDSGHAALDACREKAVDVVVTDLQMPGVHGLELISLLRDLSPRPQIIAVSGTGSDQLAVAEGLGAEATLLKPVFPDKLLGAVDEALAGAGTVPTLVVSDPPHQQVDLDAASAVIGLDVFQTRLKFVFPAPEVLAASDARRAAQIAERFKHAGVRLALIDGRALAEIPWPDPVSIFAFTDSGLTVTLENRALTIPYDAPGVAVYCSVPTDTRSEVRRAKQRASVGAALKAGGAGPAVAEALERVGSLDLYVQREAALQRITIVGGITDFSGLGEWQRRTHADNLEVTLVECQRRFHNVHFDARLENVRPRDRFVPGEDNRETAMRKRYSFGTPELRDVLESISPELGELTQYELGSRLGYLTSRDR